MDINQIIRQAVEEVLSQVGALSSAPAQEDLSPQAMAKYIDHTLLKPDADLAAIKKVCDEAKQYQFASVCCNTGYVAYVAEQLKGSGVTPCVVVGFPLGACTTETKVFETMDAISKGAREVDMVINVGAIKSKNWDLVLGDIKAVADATHKGGALLKVILETCLLTDDEKVKACQLSKQAGADFVKTSTGFSTGGATVEDVKLMREAVGPTMGVKASGGVKTYDDAVAMIKAGATRLGTSSGAAIVSGKQPEHKCIGCGLCKAQCPRGATTITKSMY